MVLPATINYMAFGDDLLDGSYDNDLIYGHEGSDTIIGGEGKDEIYGGNDNDVIYGDAVMTAEDSYNQTYWGDSDKLYGISR